MIFKVAGTSNVSSDMIKDNIAKYIPKGSKVITDVKVLMKRLLKKIIGV